MLIIQPIGIKAIHVYNIIMVSRYIDGMIKIWNWPASFHILTHLLPLLPE